MITLKKCFYALVPIAVGIVSCNHTSDTGFTPGQNEYKPPVSQPLVLSKPKKINWDSIKAVPVHPLVKHFDLDKLPAQSYDTAGFKPFKYPVEETHLDINSLPEKDLDIDKLQSRPLKFKTEKLPPPRLIHAGPPHLKDLNLSLFDLGDAQGLKGQVISCLFTDRDGFLWIATGRGLYRYDGGTLMQYIDGEFDFQHYMFSMLQDASGRIWIGTLGAGIVVLDPKAGTLKRTNKSMGLSADNTGRILQDKQQRIWLTTSSSLGVNIIDPKTETIKLLDKAHGLADTITNAGLVQDKNNRIWIGTGNHGVNVVDLKNKKIQYLDKAKGLSSDSVNNLLFDRSGHLWIGLQGGIMNVVDLQKNTIQTIREAQHPKANSLGLLADSRGKIWVGNLNNGGLTIIDPEKHQYKTQKKRDGLTSDQIVNVTEDTQGQVWVATTAGLNMFSDNKTVLERIGKERVYYLAEDHRGLVWEMRAFSGFDIIDRKSKTIRHLGVKQGLGSDTTVYVYDVQGKIYTITNAGIDIIDPQAKTMVHIGKAEGFISGINSTFDVDKTGRIWLAGSDGLNVFDPKANTMKHIGKVQGVNGNGLANILKDAEGRLWVSSNSGVIQVINPVGYTIQTLINNGPPFIDQGGGALFLDDQKGNMWLGTDKGIYIASLKNKTLSAFSIPQGLIGEKVATLLQRDSQIYASTTGGITIITPPAEGMTTNKKWGVRSFGPEYGLDKLNPNFAGTDVISSDGHFLWADYGLTVLDLSKKDTTVPPAYISGMNIMDQPAIFTGRSPTVSNGKVWDKVNGPFNLPVNLQMPHDQNYMQFFYGTLNFKQRDTTWYRYRLVGADTGWGAKTPLDHSRNYFSLAPGKYTFEVVSKSSDNGWSKPASFSFIITPPWWQTWWAYLIYVFLFGGTIWAFVTYRSMQLIKEKRVLEQKVKARTEEVIQQKEEIEAQRDSLEKAFSDLKSTQTQLIQSEKMASLGELTAGIAHEIQNPLNFVNNFSEVNAELIDEMQQEIDKGNYDDVKTIAADIKENQQKISQHGKRADFIVKGMLQHSRSNTGEKQPTNLNLLADEFLRLSFHGLRAKDKSFNAEMVTHFAPDLPKVTVVQQDIGRVILNLINNAFYAVNQKKKTAGYDYKPEVIVTTLSENGKVIIKVRDNGNGIPAHIRDKIMQPFFTTKPTGEGTGLGLSLSYDMVVHGHGGKIEVNTKEGEFTEFTVSLSL